MQINTIDQLKEKRIPVSAVIKQLCLINKSKIRLFVILMKDRT